MAKAPIPEVLPSNPISLACPFCKAKPGNDCVASAGGFAVVHVQRLAAAAAAEDKAKRPTEPT